MGNKKSLPPLLPLPPLPPDPLLLIPFFINLCQSIKIA
ncbi:hypothetical protein PL10110_170084 [Planktothrix agardhii]|nr:hypothetical protein PL10110_170084 [Planktothrix agardhii]